MISMKFYDYQCLGALPKNVRNSTIFFPNICFLCWFKCLPKTAYFNTLLRWYVFEMVRWLQAMKTLRADCLYLWGKRRDLREHPEIDVFTHRKMRKQQINTRIPTMAKSKYRKGNTKPSFSKTQRKTF